MVRVSTPQLIPCCAPLAPYPSCLACVLVCHDFYLSALILVCCTSPPVARCCWLAGWRITTAIPAIIRAVKLSNSSACSDHTDRSSNSGLPDSIHKLAIRARDSVVCGTAGATPRQLHDGRFDSSISDEPRHAPTAIHDAANAPFPA